MTVTRYTLQDAPFAGHTGRGVRVAVVDSGIATGHQHVGDVGTGVSFIAGVKDTLDRIGHGTAVAAAIREKAPGAVLIPVKVFDRALKTDAQTLAHAIDWAVEHDCRVINLSLGTLNAEHTELLQAAVTAAAGRGSVVVSAYESDGVRWLPGSLEPAAGVLADAEIDRDAILIDSEPGRSSRVHASIYPRPIPGVPRERNLNGISFSVANASGFLARMLEGSPSSAGNAATEFPWLERKA